MASDAKNEALDNLKQLIYKGRLSTEVKIGDVLFSISSLSVAEHLAVASESGIAETPKTLVEMYRYLPILLKYCVKKVNGVIVEPAELEKVFNTSDSDILFQIANAYWALYKNEKAAENELKNTSATQSQGFFGK